MTECEEVAVSMNPLRRLTFNEARRLVRGDMLGESETIISNVAEALAAISRRKFPTLHEISEEIMTILGRSTHLVAAPTLLTTGRWPCSARQIFTG